MADFEYINIDTTAEKIEKMANLETTYTPEAGKIPIFSQADTIRSGPPKSQDDCANKKYVDKAVNGRIPKVAESNVMAYPKAVVSISDLEIIDGKTYPKDTAYKHLNIDDGYSKDYPTIPDVSLTKGFIATRDSTTGNLWTGAPVDDVDCANKKYVDDALAQSGGGGTTNYELLENKPQINGVELLGNKSLSELGIDIPTKTSDLENDSGFVDDTAFENYYTKTEVDEKTVVDQT